MNYKITINILKELMNTRQPLSKRNNVPYPQADNFQTVIDLINYFNTKEYINKIEIKNLIEYDLRQADYYYNVLAYFEIAENNFGLINLTEKGKNIANQRDLAKQNQLLIAALISDDVIYFGIKSYIETYQIPEREKIINLMERYLKLSESTIRRRSITVSNYISWIISRIE